jgi:hypothetical protein
MNFKSSLALAASLAIACSTPAGAGGLSGFGGLTGAVSAVGAAVTGFAGSTATSGFAGSQSTGSNGFHGKPNHGLHGKKILKHALHFKKKDGNPRPPPMASPPVLSDRIGGPVASTSCSADQLVRGMCPQLN